VEQAHRKQAASSEQLGAEQVVTPLDTISGSDARLVLDAPMYYHWPSGEPALSGLLVESWTACAGSLPPAAISVTPGGCCAAVVWLALQGDLIWQKTFNGGDSISGSKGQPPWTSQVASASNPDALCTIFQYSNCILLLCV
jgi:hypothetical protein